MAEAVYLLCAATSLLCAVLLLRGYFRSRARFLLWCALCFIGLGINNSLLFIDRGLFRETDLYWLWLDFQVWRSIVAMLGLSLLLFGLIWDTQRR